MPSLIHLPRDPDPNLLLCSSATVFLHLTRSTGSCAASLHSGSMWKMGVVLKPGREAVVVVVVMVVVAGVVVAVVVVGVEVVAVVVVVTPAAAMVMAVMGVVVMVVESTS